jgi:hypothetical protein
LAWLSEHLKENGLPATSSKLIADREGNIIARLPHPEEFVGKNLKGTHERIMDGGEAGWEEATGVDGITRIFGYVPPSLPPKDFFLSIGEAKAEEFAAIDSATLRGAALILAGLWAAIFVAWAGRRLVSSPTQELLWAAADQRPSNGECGVRLAKLLAPKAIPRAPRGCARSPRFRSLQRRRDRLQTGSLTARNGTVLLNGNRRSQEGGR